MGGPKTDLGKFVMQPYVAHLQIHREKSSIH